MPAGTATTDRPLEAWLRSAWPVRVAWFLLPLLAGPGLASALEDRSGSVRLVAQVGLWAGWVVALVATLVPTTVSLTALRILAPASVASVLLAAVADGRLSGGLVAAGAACLLAAVVAFLPTTGDLMINGSAYGPERRMALRIPAPLAIGPVQLVWLVVFAGAVTGPLLLATGHWAVGVPVSAVGAAAAGFGGRSLHRLSRRWVVFVPAGFVLHDHFTMAESLLMRRPDVAGLGPALRDLAGAVDLTAGAAGLALEVRLVEPARIGIRERSGDITDTDADRLVFTPSLPGVLLREAAGRGLPVHHG